MKVLSKKNPYYISKHRHLELKHFCLQYPEWKREYKHLEGIVRTSSVIKVNSGVEDYVGDQAARMAILSRRMELIEECAKRSDPYLGQFIFIAVTEGRSYTWLYMNMNIPCGKDLYYKLYRRFFWVLSEEA